MFAFAKAPTGRGGEDFSTFTRLLPEIMIVSSWRSSGCGVHAEPDTAVSTTS